MAATRSSSYLDAQHLPPDRPSFITDTVSLFGAIDARAQPSSARQSEVASAFPHTR